MFPAEFFLVNRRRLFDSSESPLIVVSANTQMQRNGDSGYPFRQDSNFWYLTGVNEPDCIVVISEHESYVIMPYKDQVMRIFDGQADKKSVKQISGVDNVYDAAKGWKRLKSDLQNCDNVATLLPNNLRRYALAVNPARNKLMKRIKRHKPGIGFEDVRLQLAHLRMVKRPEEVRAIKQAIDITGQSLKAVTRGKWYKRYAHEFQLEADISAGFRKNGAVGHAYSPIVAVGDNACTLHYVANSGRIKKGKLLLLDVGAEYQNYAADITRVFPVGEKFTRRQAEVVGAVREVQDYALSLIKPGLLMRDYERQVEAYMGTVLKRLGLIKNATRRSIRRYYPHATSHMLGLDAHDAADYAMPFAQNMVMTVEPGIYIPKEQIGVRIEDDVRVTKTGVEVLSINLPQPLA